MTAVSGLGPWPGTDALEAQTVVLGDLTSTPAGIDGLPFRVQPAPGTGSGGGALDATGRAAALLVDLPVEVGVHGWKLADHPGRDEARARASARQELDALAIAALGYAGPLVTAVQGPLSLAASLYLARGDRALADAGAVRDLAESLGTGLAEEIGRLRVAVPGAEPLVLLHEPLLAAVLVGAVPTFSGYSAIRPVPGPVVAERLRTVADAVRGAGASRVVVHLGEAWASLPAVARAGVDAVGLAVGTLDERAWEHVAQTVESGVDVWSALPPVASSQCAGPDVRGQADTLLRPWRRVGLPVARLDDVVLVPAGTSSTPDGARRALADVVRAAEVVAEAAAGG
ncbi:hypothetical protein [Cellulomonas aerilata]|uniref:Methionine synthase n=1 Tax=Cellulomonas aerilata TaxID=515326 RepID=A0A512DGY2_9CELL|nr:hypothetical protein [Cellulomonas aerilata]GEO35686.1 methionine synthase [Cellulomonas aerilata]